MEREMGKATIDDVARHCGLSRATVSRVLNRDGSVKPATRARVEAAVEALGYSPSYLARGLSGGKKNVIAVLVPDVTMHYYSNLLKSVDQVARKRNYHILIKTHDYKSSVLTLLREERVDGFIIRNSGEPEVDESVVRKLKQQGVPFVFIGKPDQDGIPSISVDNVGGARAMAHHFVEHGFKSILYVSGPEKKVDSRDRVYGFRLGLTEKGQDPKSVTTLVGNFTRDGGYRAAREFFSGNRADAVFAANDQMALGVLHYLYEKKINVPRDVAVAGFDDSFFSEFICPPLTTVRQPMSEIGELAMENIILQLESSSNRNTRMILPTRLVIRESCGCSKTGGPAAP
jgi:DNA-binding LacI/PurR family transcriptional regulator